MPQLLLLSIESNRRRKRGWNCDKWQTAGITTLNFCQHRKMSSCLNYSFIYTKRQFMFWCPVLSQMHVCVFSPIMVVVCAWIDGNKFDVEYCAEPLLLVPSSRRKLYWFRIELAWLKLLSLMVWLYECALCCVPCVPVITQCRIFTGIELIKIQSFWWMTVIKLYD